MKKLKKWITGLVVVYMALSANSAFAKYNPFKTNDKTGVVIIRIDAEGFARDLLADEMDKDPNLKAKIAANPGAVPAVLNDIEDRLRIDNFGLDVVWFDPDTKKTPTKLLGHSSIFLDSTYVVTDGSDGHYYYVGSVGGHMAAIIAASMAVHWRDCFNTQTLYFDVKANSYTYLGVYNPYRQYKAIHDAISSGKMPHSVLSNQYLPPLTDDKLTDFTPAAMAPDTVKDVEKLISDQTGISASVLTPELHPTDFPVGQKGLIPDGDSGCSQG